MSTFSGLSIASSALAAQRRALETAGHNVANANTAGYSRQRLELSARPGGSVGIHTGTDFRGGGVDVQQQTRVVDSFLIQRANAEHGQLGYADEMQQIYSRVEQAFDEPGDRGLAAQMEQFWDAWDDVAATPEDEAARAALLQRASAISSTFGQVSRRLDGMQEDALQRADAITVDINGIAAQIADLNVAITSAANAGAPANDLMDQRDELVRNLASHVGVRTNVHDDGQMDVSIGGVSLVSGDRFNTVSLDTSTPGAAVLLASSSTVPLRLEGGGVQGLLEAANTVVPGTQADLDALALQMRDVVNAQHALGQDLDMNPAGNFFSGTSARDFGLDPAVDGNPRAVAAALAGNGALDGENAVTMAELSGLSGGPDDTYRAMIAALGVNAQTANRRHELQAELTQQVDMSREEVSGVSIDEEMTNLVAFQQAYQASARVITAVDEMLSTLIQGTGRVGT